MSSDINVQTFSGKVNITSNLLVGTSHLFVDTINNRVGLVTASPQAGLHVNSNAYVESNVIVGSDIQMNVTPGRITAGAFHGAFVGDGTHITGGSWVNGTDVVYLSTIGDKVGIGVNQPLHKLDVDGDINMSTGSQLRMNGTPAVFSNWDVSGSDISRSSGNVGIGVVEPVYKLDVDGDINMSTGSQLRMNGTPAVFSNWDVSGSDISRSSGNVGIGTTIPQTSLQIKDETDTTGTGDAFITGLNNNTSNRKPTECLRLSGKYHAAGSGALLRFTNQHDSGTNPNTGEYNLAGIAGFDYAAAWGGGLCFYTAPTTGNGGDLTARMVIDQAGKVGIGTSSPAGTLHVQADNRVHITAGTVPAFTGLGAASSDNGRSQIVLTSAYSDLVIASSYVNNNHGSTLSFAAVNPSNTAEYRKFVINQGNWGSRKDFLDFGLSASTSDANPHLAINSTDTVLTLDGNNKRVGIGTISPTSTLDVDGTVTAPTFSGALSGNATTATTATNQSGGTVSATTGTFTGKLSVPSGVSYNPGLQLGTQTTYADDNLYSLRWGGSTLMGMGLHSSTRGAFGKQGVALHIPNTEEFSVKTNGWATIFGCDGATKKAYFGGNVGIGTTTPLAKLHVSGEGTINATSDWISRINSASSSIGSIQEAWTSASIYATNDIVTRGYLVAHAGALTASDERIKKDIVDIDDGSALEKLRLLKPKQYKYKDHFINGSEPVWGFIAQEVRETLPHATRLQTDCIPNIYELVSVSNSNVITFTNFDTSTFRSNATVIMVYDTKNEEHLITVNEVIDEHTIRVEEDLSEWTGSVDETGNVVSGNQIFVYGEQVDDFVVIKKDSIFTVATAALQEVDRQQQSDKVRITTLETQLQVEKEKTQQLTTDLQAEKTENEITRLKLANAESRISILEQSISSILSKLNV